MRAVATRFRSELWTHGRAWLGLALLVGLAGGTSLAAAAALIAGIPAGIAAGHFGWRLFSNPIAVVPSPEVPAVPVALLVPGTLVLAGLISLGPGRAAARTPPATVLRTE